MISRFYDGLEMIKKNSLSNFASFHDSHSQQRTINFREITALTAINIYEILSVDSAVKGIKQN